MNECESMNNREPVTIVVAALTKAGEHFVKQLLVRGVPFTAVTNSAAERQQLAKLGVRSILLVNTIDSGAWPAPEGPIGQVFLFESSLSLCCRYLRMVRGWTDQTVHVITGRTNGRLIYKSLGADRITHSATGGIAFLLDANSAESFGKG
jgi:hypothetical protein